MADNLSKWVGGSRFVKLKKWGNGVNNSGNSYGKNHPRNRFLSVMNRALHEYCKTRKVRMNSSGVPF